MIAKKIIVTGDVQGVSYRYFARSEAKRLGLSGWAKNEHDGTVSIVIQGDPDRIDGFVAWTHEGSPMATVSEVKTVEVETDDSLKGFEVR